jgi:hypothetical protein
MTITSRNCTVFVALAMLFAVLACGCTSSGSTNSGSSEAGTSAPASDDTGYHSSFDEIAGTYVNPDNPESYITLNRDGSAAIVIDSSKIDTSIYMEMGVLKLADGTSIGTYPVRYGTLTYQGMNFIKK